MSSTTIAYRTKASRNALCSYDVLRYLPTYAVRDVRYCRRVCVSSYALATPCPARHGELTRFVPLRREIKCIKPHFQYILYQERGVIGLISPRGMRLREAAYRSQYIYVVRMWACGSA
eukprot:2477376-Rhodomonas_salina.5